VLQVIVLGGASGEGTATEPDAPAGPGDDELLWSIMHMGGGGVALPSGALEVGDLAMMVGAYAGFDYS
jgi:hypothetical protein